MLTTDSVATGKKLRKDRLLIFISILAVSVILLSAFFVDQQIQPKATPAIEPTPTIETAPAIEPIQSVSGYYLSYMSNASRIFVVCANASYGSYPYPTVTYPPFGSDPNGLIAQNGELCVIINVTLRNDYSTQNPAPNPLPFNSTLVNIALTAQIFNGKNQINSTDITNAFPIASVATNKAFTRLNYGESTTLSIYLATNSTYVTSFQIIPDYIGLLTPP